MGKHAVKQGKRTVRERKRANRKRRGVQPGAMSIAGLLAGGLVLAPPTPSAAPGAPMTDADVSLAASIIFIDGHDYPYGSERMADEITGQYQYDFQPCTTPCTHLTPPTTSKFIFINQPQQYPGTLGLVDGPTAPTGDQSVAMGQTAIHALIGQQIKTGNTPVTVVAYSEGAVAASHEVSAWQPTSPVAFVLIGDPERPNGGILARMPAGTYIPVLGITGGNATPATGAPVVMVTRQYDGVADAPVYVGNVLADVNALLGAYYLHGNGNYFDVDPNAAGNIVTTSANGNMTDILVPAAPGALPLFVPLAQAGVPQAILVALDPAVRAIIETGYDRTGDPSQQVMFAFLPPPSAWPADAQAVAAGFASTAQELPAALAASFPSLPGLAGPLPTTTSPTPPPVSVTTTPLVRQTQLVSQLLPHHRHSRRHEWSPRRWCSRTLSLTNRTPLRPTGISRGPRLQSRRRRKPHRQSRPAKPGLHRQTPPPRSMKPRETRGRRRHQPLDRTRRQLTATRPTEP